MTLINFQHYSPHNCTENVLTIYLTFKKREFDDNNTNYSFNLHYQDNIKYFLNLEF